ncbi:glucokinase [Palleronia caenipelagi]|uniref:Glucokinase n=1 Tax=Palleronia caenipelagi TaxID=2489174 RepID=A0A547Q5C2_9RHOB|nr:glucokinase [Palleronia caenipelagi]TRD21563.1 glucokinase [Palleronia caenipelagi]
MTALSLVSDVGGTNTRVALASDGVVDTSSIARFRNAEHSGLDEIYRSYLSQRDVTCEGACIAIAGPVMDGHGTLTNRGWSFDRDQLAACTGADTTALLNDLQAQGHAVAGLPESSLHDVIIGPRPQEHSAVLVIGVGTGFNSVPVFRTETGVYVPPCETGHTSFPALSEDDLSLSQWVARHHGFPGVEDVLSGRGLERVYAWASGADTALDSGAIMAAIAQGDDPVADKTARAFCTALGRVAGDLALTHLPFGGVYLVGGMSNAFRPYLQSHGFVDAFRAKGRFTEFMEQFAVRVVEDDYAALTGCARRIAETL